MGIKMGITTEQSMRARKDYVKRVRESFAENDVSNVGETRGTSFSFTKLSAFIALILFMAFYMWQESGEEWHGYYAKDLIPMIEENLYDTNPLDYVMIEK